LPENVNATSGATAEAAAPARAATPATDGTAGEATRPDSMDAKAYYDLGAKEASAGRYGEAVEAFRRAVFLDRKNARAYLALGDAYAALGRWRESVDAYEQAARLNPNDAETYQRLGRQYGSLRETTPAAIADAEESVGSGSAPGSGGGATGGSATGAAREVDRDPTAVYRIGPGDVLDIRALDGRERRTTSYEVTPTGLLTYPTLSEPLKVEGLTTEQVAARLGVELKLRAGGADPEVAVGVREYVSHAVIVSGMVKNAGTKILQREGVPLYVIIAYAQPLPEAGQALIVARATGRSTAVDLSDVRAMKTLVRPGDVITVRSRPDQYVYIAGAVR